MSTIYSKNEKRSSKKRMVNGFFIFNNNYRLVPDISRKDINEGIMFMDGNFSLIDDDEWWFSNPDETFNSSSIIRMLALCANDYNYHDHATISVEYNMDIGHDIIRYTWYNQEDFCDYYLFPCHGKIRLMARLKNVYHPDAINLISIDLDMSTTVSELYIKIYEDLDQYTVCPILMGNPIKFLENSP